MNVDIGQLTPNLDPKFTQWRTGKGNAAEWTLVADTNAEGDGQSRKSSYEVEQ